MDKMLEQLFYVLLGGALDIKEKVESRSEDLKAWQEKSEDNARTFFNEMAERGEQEKEKLKGLFRDILKEAVADLNLATKDDIEQLKQELRP